MREVREKNVKLVPQSEKKTNIIFENSFREQKKPLMDDDAMMHRCKIGEGLTRLPPHPFKGLADTHDDKLSSDLLGLDDAKSIQKKTMPGLLQTSFINNNGYVKM